MGNAVKIQKRTYGAVKLNSGAQYIPGAYICFRCAGHNSTLSVHVKRLAYRIGGSDVVRTCPVCGAKTAAAPLVDDGTKWYTGKEMTR